MKRCILENLNNKPHSNIIGSFTNRQLTASILDFLAVLDLLQSNKKSTIAIYADFSFGWLVIYLTSLFKGCNLVIIPVSMSLSEVSHALLLLDVEYIFVNLPGYSWITKIPNIRAVFIQEDTASHMRIGYTKDADKRTLLLINNMLSNDRWNQTSVSMLNKIMSHDEFTWKVTTPTAGIDDLQIKWVQCDEEIIESFIIKAKQSMPYTEGDKIYTADSVSDKHFISVLLPFIMGCSFVNDRECADIVIEDTVSAENIWRNTLNKILSNWLYSLLYSASWLKPLTNLVLSKQIRRQYKKDVSAVIVYNNQMGLLAQKDMLEALPLYSTYGSQETCQLVSVNDYKSKESRKPFCVGKLLVGTCVDISETEEDELVLVSSTLFTAYAKNEIYFKEVRALDRYNTGDVGYLVNGYLFIYGRTSARFYTDEKIPIQFDKLERLMKSIPYFQEVLICKLHSNFTVAFIRPNVSLIESRKLGILTFSELVKRYMREIKSTLEIKESINNYRLVTDSFHTAFNGLPYRISAFQDQE